MLISFTLKLSFNRISRQKQRLAVQKLERNADEIQQQNCQRNVHIGRTSKVSAPAAKTISGIHCNYKMQHLLYYLI